MKESKEKTKKKSSLSDFFSDADLTMFAADKVPGKNIVELLKYFNGDALAAVVWYQKYADTKNGEVHPDEMHMRMASAFFEIENKYNISDKAFAKKYKKEVEEHLSDYGQIRDELTEEDIFASFYNFEHIIPQGSIMSQLGVDSIGSLSNCFVTASPDDSYGGIFKTDQTLAQVAKRRGGVGVEISTLRPSGSVTSNVAKTSTGAVSFMPRFSNTIREVAQGGRRGALMITMDIAHPDIQEFITVKQDLTKVTGANISVKVSDDFMKAVENNAEYCLRWPIDSRPITRTDEELNVLIEKKGKYFKFVNAKDVWDSLIKAAHLSAEPGILFWTRMTLNSPDGFYKQFSPISTNPCGEIPLPAGDSCRLIALNLTGFIENRFREDTKFNFDKFYDVTYDAMRLSDVLVDLEIEAVDTIINKIKSDPENKDTKQVELAFWMNAKKMGKEGRRTGLGFTGIGDTAALLGYKYGSDEFLDFEEKMMHVKMEAELDASIDMAIVRGPFIGWDPETEFIEVDGNLLGMNHYYQFIIDEFPEQAARMFKFGRRNISISTVAPTGSLSMLAQITSGIEPLFKPFFKRRKKIMGTEEVKADFVDDNGDRWTEHIVVHEQFKQWIYKNTSLSKNSSTWTDEMMEKAFKDSPWFGATAEEINWRDRIKVQAIAQKYTSHSISSTINLPKGTKAKEINDIYMAAWKADLKGVTVYVDGSRDGVLVSKDTSNDAVFVYKESLKRPEEVRSIAHTTQVGPDKFSVFVGLMNGLPYEIFAYKGGTKEGEGAMIKIGKGDYQFMGEGEDSRRRVITGKMTDEQEMITRLLSGSLRHGRDIVYLVEDLQKTSGNMFGFNSALARVLKLYIPDGTKGSNVCPECGDNSMVYEENCLHCTSCGYSAC